MKSRVTNAAVWHDDTFSWLCLKTAASVCKLPLYNKLLSGKLYANAFIKNIFVERIGNILENSHNSMLHSQSNPNKTMFSIGNKTGSDGLLTSQLHHQPQAVDIQDVVKYQDLPTSSMSYPNTACLELLMYWWSHKHHQAIFHLDLVFLHLFKMFSSLFFTAWRKCRMDQSCVKWGCRLYRISVFAYLNVNNARRLWKWYINRTALKALSIPSCMTM